MTDIVVTQLAVSSSGLIGAAGDLSNKVKGIIRGTGTLDPAEIAAMEIDLSDVVKYAVECTAALAVSKKK